ncbi:MAG TPA: MBL fold metallo-hydrolase [Flavobacteriaceae bacterium]|nr:MBL fold metallo-hydrolase [Flavobacteriaceae bacterium]
MADGFSSFKVLKEMLFKKTPHKSPEQKIPSVKTDLKKLSSDEEMLVWFGHSSYFMQVEGKRFLIDPVFSGSVSPIPGMMKAFDGTDIYTSEDIPDIDYLIISHDHYDHLDHKTIKHLQPKINQVICGLGVGAHFKKWGYRPSKILEKDWFDKIVLNNKISLHILPARHFSGRGLNRNNTLWCSYLLQTKSMKIYLGGDSGYDQHFAKIGQKFGKIDLAILENGQYNRPWPYIHMFPKQVLQAAKDLKAERLFPVHSSKFALS